MKKFIGLMLCLLTVLLSGCSNVRTLDDILSSKKLILAVSCDYAPYEFVDFDEQGNEIYCGADISFAKYIASELGVELIIENVGFEMLLGELQIGTADISISGFTWKDERVGNVQISNSYYQQGEGKQGILVRKADYEQNKFTTFASLNQKSVKIGAQNSSVQYDLVGENLNNATLSAFDLISMGILELNQGIIDAICVSQNIANILIAQNPDKYVFLEETFEVDEEKEGLFCLANIENVELIEKINEIIADMDPNLYQSWYDEAAQKAIELGQI